LGVEGMIKGWVGVPEAGVTWVEAI